MGKFPLLWGGFDMSKGKRVAKKPPAKTRGIEIRQRADGRFSFRARKLVDGEVYRATFDSRADAETWLKRIDVEKRADILNPRHELKQMTFRELLEKYQRAKGFDDAAHFPQIFESSLAAKRLYDIKVKDVIAFREDMASALKTAPDGSQKLDGNGRPIPKYAKATIVRRLTVISAAFGYGISELSLPLEKNPAISDLVKRPPGADTKRNRRVSKDELKYILKKMDRKVERFIVLFALYQAARLGEITKLRWQDVDFSRTLMRLHATKNVAYRQEQGPEERPLTPHSVALLKSWRRLNPEAKKRDVVFPINQDTFQVRYGRILKRCDIDDMHFHDLRHEAITRMAAYIESPMKLMKFTGHMDLKSLARYYNPDVKSLADELAASMKSRRRSS